MRRSIHFVVLAMLSVVALAAPSYAAPERLQVSVDGTHWSGGLTTPLFDEQLRWVPGDSRTATFWARNAMPSPGRLDIDLVDAAVQGLLATGDVEVAARIGEGPWFAVTAPGPRDLVPATALPARAQRQVSVRVTFDPAAGNDSQDRQLDLALGLTLAQSQVSGPAPGDGGDGDGGGDSGGDDSAAGPTGVLPGTGSPVRLGVLILAAFLCTTGLLLTFVARRRDTHERS